MSELGLIVALSTILWYLVDRFKPLWDGYDWGKYVTMCVAAVGGFGLTFSLGLDVIYAMELTVAMTMAGQILTGFLLMSGSSAISEIIERIKG